MDEGTVSIEGERVMGGVERFSPQPPGTWTWVGGGRLSADEQSRIYRSFLDAAARFGMELVLKPPAPTGDAPDAWEWLVSEAPDRVIFTLDGIRYERHGEVDVAGREVHVVKEGRWRPMDPGARAAEMAIWKAFVLLLARAQIRLVIGADPPGLLDTSTANET